MPNVSNVAQNNETVNWKLIIEKIKINASVMETENVSHCCKGDERGQWEMPFFDVF